MVTPDHDNRTPLANWQRRPSNPYDVLASESEGDSVAEEAYLPPFMIYSSDSKSDSDMSATTDNIVRNITKDKLQELMEDLEPGCTTTRTKYTYTDIGNF